MIINACPHDINVYKDNILVKTYPDIIYING